MACPIKTPDGEIDESALHDLTAIGGHILEGGIKKYSDWKQALEKTVGPVFNEGDFQTIWQNLKADARQRTGTGQSSTKSDVFIERMARRLGSNRRAADFANALVDNDGNTTILNKLVDGQALTPAESKSVSDAYTAHVLKRKPGEKSNSGPMGIVQEALDAARLDKQKAATKTPKGPLQGPPTPSDAWQKHLSGALGIPGAKQLRAQLGEAAFERVATGNATEADTAAATAAYETIRKNKPPTQGTPKLNIAPGFKDDLNTFRKSLIPPKVKPDVVPKVKLSDIPQSEQANFGRRIKAGLGDNADNFFSALRDDHRDIANALDNGHALTSEQEARLGELYIDHAPEPKTPTEATGMIKTLNDAVKESRKESAGTFKDEPAERYNVAPDKEAVQGEPPPTNDVLFDRKMADVLGGSDAAAKFRNALPTDLYDKMVTDGPKSLTPKEQETVTNAFAESAKPKAGSKPSEFVQSLKPIATEARAQIARDVAHAKTATFEASKGWVREQLHASQTPLSAKRLEQLDTALDNLKDGDHKALAHVFNQFAPRGFFKTARLNTQGSLLSNPGSLATALYSHLASAGVDNTLASGIANKLSGGLHAAHDPQLIAHAIATTLRKGVKEGYGSVDVAKLKQGIKNRSMGQIRGSVDTSMAELYHGANPRILTGEDSMHPAGDPLHPELTFGNNGPIANTVNAVGRSAGRMHGALWHAVGVGLNEITKHDAAHYAAWDEMEKSGTKWTKEQIATRTRELMDSPNQTTIDNALKLRQEQMFQNPNALADALKPKEGQKGAGATFRNAVAGAVAPIQPFVNVASNISGRGLEHTAGGSIGSIAFQIGDAASAQGKSIHNLSDFKDVWKNMPAIDRAHIAKTAARGIIGTGISALGAAGYATGAINPPDPSKGEYGSINAFGNKYEYGRVAGPYAIPLSLGAYAAENVAHGKSWIPNPAQLGESASDNPMSNQGEVLQNVFGHEHTGKNKAEPWMKAAAGYAGTAIPSVIRAIAATTDPDHILRDANSADFLDYMYNSMKKAFPGARETLPPLNVQGVGTVPEAGTVYPEPRRVPDPNMPKDTLAIDLLKQWKSDRENRQ